MIVQSFRHRARVVLRGRTANPLRFSRASSNLVGVVQYNYIFKYQKKLIFKYKIYSCRISDAVIYHFIFYYQCYV